MIGLFTYLMKSRTLSDFILECSNSKNLDLDLLISYNFGGNRQFGRVFVKLDEIGRRIGRVLDPLIPWYNCVSYKTL